MGVGRGWGCGRQQQQGHWHPRHARGQVQQVYTTGPLQAPVAFSCEPENQGPVC